MRSRRLTPFWLVLLTDVLLAGLGLVVFAYFHHVRPTLLPSEDIVIERPTAQAYSQVTEQPTFTPAPMDTPAPEDAALTPVTPTPSPTPTPAPDAPGSFANKYRDKFISGEAVTTLEDNVYTYVSQNLNITVTATRVPAVSSSGAYETGCYITDFYVRDISCLVGVLANDKYGTGQYEWLADMADRSNAVLAINGDFFGARKNGVVIRNGKLYRKNHSTFDACVIYWDGTMATFAPSQWDAERLIRDGAYQAWSFGPRLLDTNGEPMTSFNTTKAVKERNPRTAIGYFEPGHYCFVTVDGRTATNRGLTLEALAQLMKDLGCKVAYNLDGGESSQLWAEGKMVNNPYKDGRKISDAIVLKDFVEEK